MLLAEGVYEEQEHAARLSGLMEMLRARGTQPSGSVHKLFSSTVSGARSLERSPEKLTRSAETIEVSVLTPPPPEKDPAVRAFRMEVEQLRRDVIARTPGGASNNEAAGGC